MLIVCVLRLPRKVSSKEEFRNVWSSVLRWPKSPKKILKRKEKRRIKAICKHLGLWSSHITDGTAPTKHVKRHFHDRQQKLSHLIFLLKLLEGAHNKQIKPNESKKHFKTSVCMRTRHKLNIYKVMNLRQRQESSSMLKAYSAFSRRQNMFLPNIRMEEATQK